MSIDYTRRAQTLPGVARQYLTGKNVFAGKPPAFLSDEEYERSLSTFVVACVDLVIEDPQTGKILLGKRQQEPQPDWWIIGGRMHAGESYEATAYRKAMHELGIEVLADQLWLVGHYSFIWDTNAQGSGGCHMLGVTLGYTLASHQVAEIAPNEEYATVRWTGPKTIIDAPVGTYHPALVKTIADYIVLG